MESEQQRQEQPAIITSAHIAPELLSRLEVLRHRIPLRGSMVQTPDGKWKTQTPEGTVEATPEEVAYAEAQIARGERYRLAREGWESIMAKWPRGLKWLGRWLNPEPDWRELAQEDPHA